VILGFEDHVRRREFITLLGGLALTWPRAAGAQQGKRMRRVGVLMPLSANDPQAQVRNAAFLQGLLQFGWTIGNNVQIDYRWSAGNDENARKYALELVALAPDVIFASGTQALGSLQRATRTVPIVFAQVADPVGAGFVDSLARPGGNITGFTSYEYGLGAKWLEVLKQIAPNVTRVAIVRDPASPTGIGLWGAILSVSPSFGVELRPVDVRDAGEIERALTTFAASPNGGLIVTGSALALMHRDLIIALAARHRLPAVYYDRYYAAAGGLISYGPNTVEQYRLAAGYVDRILKGEKPTELPVQAPTKYELAINLNTAKTLGLDVPASVLARADEVIE
jgi:putative tryptophan/tyrosine transport system substrate-binding protein